MKKSNLDSLKNFSDSKFHKFVPCLDLFDKITKSCFGMQLLPEWESNITEFKKCYLTLDSSVTPKIHSIFFEIPIFIKRQNKPLGYFSEAKYKAVH